MKNFIFLFLFFILSCQRETTNQIEYAFIDLSKQDDSISCFDKHYDFNDEKTLFINNQKQKRLNVLMNAKATPVLFTREPIYEPSGDSKVLKLRELINSGKTAWPTFNSLIPSFINNPKFGRDVLLKEGYIYTDDSNAAYAISQLIKAHHIFNDKYITIQRGNVKMRAEKVKNTYFFKDGPFAKEEVSLMMYDRIYTKEPNEQLHIDFRYLKNKYQFDTIDIVKYSDSHILSNLYYDNLKIKSIINLNNMEIECQESNSDIDINLLYNKIVERKNRFIGIQNLKQAISNSVIERLPFDEPIHEYGLQLDGKLRPRWEYSYLLGKTSFNYNGDKYYIYDNLGRPKVPQVCIDFIIDTFDRASGTWYNTKEKPQKNIGSFNSSEHSSFLRNVTEFNNFVNKNKQWFEVNNIKSIKHFNEEDFYSYMYDKNYKDGDIILIKGKTPWDKKEVHFHSFFIFETDPISGIPTIIAGNAGPASFRPWEIERRRTPDRFIFMSVRLKQDFLDLLSKNKIIQLSPLTIR